MTEKLANNRESCQRLLERLTEILDGRRMRFMEVCGTHTVAIFQSGLRSLLPENIIHVSGPGCPVCVTHDTEVALFLEAAELENVVLATFGDLLRVPGPDGRSLKQARASGANVRIVYSPLDALELARKNPSQEIVFPGIGFETTAPAVACAIQLASREGLDNFSVLSLHKLVPPAIRTLLNAEDCAIDAFLLPGHVATVTGLAPFEFLPHDYGKPAAVSGFEPSDILLALLAMASNLIDEKPSLVNAYPRAVNPDGNPRARELMRDVFEPCDARWRGLDVIAGSGLAISEKYAKYDAMRKFGLEKKPVGKLSGCRCGAVLQGHILPDACPLFGRKCTPANPVGPCMVSSEGSCAAHYKYGDYQ